VNPEPEAEALDPLIDDACRLYQAAVRRVQANVLFRDLDLLRGLDRSPDDYRRVVVVGAGKASMAMAGAVEALLGERIDQGLVVVPYGYRATLPASQHRPQRVEVVEAAHPVPDAAGVAAAARVHRWAASCGADDLLLVLLSGGGSALWPSFAPALSLEDAQATFRLLLHSGAGIHQLNTVRKHLSTLNGGRLAALAAPATVLTLVISDVVGDDLSVIASGPTVPDDTTYRDAVAVLQTFELWEQVPGPVRAHLEHGARGDVPETPRPGSPVFERVRTVLLGSNRQALAAMQAAAAQRGYATRICSRALTGEAREVGLTVARAALAVEAAQPTCLLWGGETTVTVTGAGQGGRNQEVALAAALGLEGTARTVVVLSGGTDGIDGPTQAAGAWATPRTAAAARSAGLDPAAYQADNDAYAFFARLGGLLTPGPTHTNVMDVLIALVAPHGGR